MVDAPLQVPFLDLACTFREVDLSSLDLDSDEALCFFANLYHLIVRHMLLVLGPPSSAKVMVRGPAWETLRLESNRSRPVALVLCPLFGSIPLHIVASTFRTGVALEALILAFCPLSFSFVCVVGPGGMFLEESMSCTSRLTRCGPAYSRVAFVDYDITQRRGNTPYASLPPACARCLRACRNGLRSTSRCRTKSAGMCSRCRSLSTAC